MSRPAFKIKHKIHVQYAWKKYSAAGILLDEADNWTHNLFTNHGKNQFLSLPVANGSNQYSLGMCIGNGTGTHNPGTPRLLNWVSGTSVGIQPEFSSSKNFGAPPFYLRGNFVQRFGPAIPGSPVNITEFGLSINEAVPTNSTDLASVALIEDALGNPTSVSVQADEYLDVYAQFTVYIEDEVTGQMPVDVRGSPSTFDYVMAPANVDGTPQFNKWDGFAYNVGFGRVLMRLPGAYATTGSQTGSQSYYGVTGMNRSAQSGMVGGTSTGKFPTSELAAYVPGSFQRDATWRHSLSGGVGNGINGFLLSSGDSGFGPLALWWPNDTLDKANGELMEVTIRHMVG